MRRSASVKRYWAEGMPLAAYLPPLLMAPTEINVHLERSSPRARYAVQEVLGTMLGWTVNWEDDRVRFEALTGPRLVYGIHAVPGAFHVLPVDLLGQQGLHPLDPEVKIQDGLPLLFPVTGGDLPFDPFAASFYLLSRYEEALGVGQDPHGRPVAGQLHGARHAYLERPVVDEWALLLATRWRLLDPALPPPQRRYRLVNTVDLDNGFKYLGRPLWRTLGSMFRDAIHGEWRLLPQRLRVLSGSERDPYDIYAELQEPLSQGAEQVLFFVLSAARSAWDHAVPLSFGPYAGRIRGISAWAEVGLHPSYKSSERPGLTAHESLALQSVTGKPVRCTRQHFLRMRSPGTYRELERLGVQDEYSMGFHEQLGFRAGTCTPYRWYDLGEERCTALRIHPFSVMDNTLITKLKLGPDAALAEASRVIARVKAVNGTFIGLWHESFLAHGDANAPWREAILRIIQQARP